MKTIGLIGGMSWESTIVYYSIINAFIRIMEDLVSAGAEGIVLGCTEIPLLIKQEDIEVPIFVRPICMQ